MLHSNFQPCKDQTYWIFLKNVLSIILKLRPMNLRYSADFRRSHLIEPQPLTDKTLYFNRLFQICLSNCSKQFHHTCKKTLENGLPLRGKKPWTCREKTRNEADSTLYTSFCWLSKNCNEIIWSLVQKSQNCSEKSLRKKPNQWLIENVLPSLVKVAWNCRSGESVGKLYCKPWNCKIVFAVNSSGSCSC